LEVLRKLLCAASSFLFLLGSVAPWIAVPSASGQEDIPTGYVRNVDWDPTDRPHVEFTRSVYAEWPWPPHTVTYHHVIDLSISTREWKEGGILIVKATCSESRDPPSNLTGLISGVRINVLGGEVDVVSCEPPYGGMRKYSDECTVWWREKLPQKNGPEYYPSGTTFTATFRLGKPLLDPYVDPGWAHLVQVSTYDLGEMKVFEQYRSAVLWLQVEPDCIRGTVYDVWTNIPQAAHIRETPMSGVKVRLLTLPDRTVVAQNVTLTDGSYMLKPKSLDPKQRYLVRATCMVEGRELRQWRNITGPQRVDFYLPATLVKNYLGLVEQLDSIELPSLSDVDLMLGLGFGGPLKEASVYGPLGELAKLGIQIEQPNQSLKKRLEAFLDKILADAPPCRSLLKGEAASNDPWNMLLRLTLVLGFIRNRVDDAYISVDNVVKATTVAVMTSLMMDAMRATAKTRLPTVDKLTSKPVRWAQEKLLKGSDETMKRIASTLHISLFAGGFGLGGVDWLLEKAGIKDPATRATWKTVMAKGIRAISDLVRKNFGTSLLFEVIFQGARTLGDAALLELYLWLTRGEIENALWAANNSQAINKPLEAVNAISVMDTEHEDWHKTQHSWAVSWFKAANVFRGVGGIWGTWTAPTGVEYPFIWEAATPLIKRLRAANVWLTVAGIGSFAGVIITELRALYVTWSKQLDAVYKSFGEKSPLASRSGLGSPAKGIGNPPSQPSSLQTAPALEAYLATLSKLGISVQTDDKDAAAAAVLELEEPDGRLATELESSFLRLAAAYPKALFQAEGFDNAYTEAVDAYTRALIEQADLYASTAMWLRGEAVDAADVTAGIESTSRALADAWNALYRALGPITDLTVPGFLFLSPKIPERITPQDQAEVSVDVRNVGDEPVRNTKVTLWVSDTLTINSNPTIDLGEIAPGATAQATWKLSAGTGRPGDVATFWFTAQGDTIEQVEASGASLLTFGNTTQLEIVANSPVRMMVSDSLGHRVGYDPETGSETNEIEGATYSGLDSSPQRVTIPDPLGLYQIDLLGTGDGSYHLEVKALQNGQLVAVQTKEGTIKRGEWSTTLAPVTQTNGTVLLPSGQKVEPDQGEEQGEGVSAFPAAVVAAMAAIVGVAVLLALLARKRSTRKATATQQSSSN